VIITRFGVAAGPDISPIVTAKKMPCKRADDGIEQPESQTSGIDYHRRLTQFIQLMLNPTPQHLQAITATVHPANLDPICKVHRNRLRRRDRTEAQ